MHQARRFRVVDVVGAEDLAKKLTEQTWCLCAGFRLGGLLLVNDSTHGDGAGEWAVFKVPAGATPVVAALRQIESITFSWMTSGKALGLLEALRDGRLRSPMGTATVRCDHPAGDCRHCA